MAIPPEYPPGWVLAISVGVLATFCLLGLCCPRTPAPTARGAVDDSNNNNNYLYHCYYCYYYYY